MAEELQAPIFAITFAAQEEETVASAAVNALVVTFVVQVPVLSKGFAIILVNYSQFPEMVNGVIRFQVIH